MRLWQTLKHATSVLIPATHGMKQLTALLNQLHILSSSTLVATSARFSRCVLMPLEESFQLLSGSRSFYISMACGIATIQYYLTFVATTMLLRCGLRLSRRL